MILPFWLFFHPNRPYRAQLKSLRSRNRAKVKAAEPREEKIESELKSTKVEVLRKGCYSRYELLNENQATKTKARAKQTEAGIAVLGSVQFEGSPKLLEPFRV